MIVENGRELGEEEVILGLNIFINGHHSRIKLVFHIHFSHSKIEIGNLNCENNGVDTSIDRKTGGILNEVKHPIVIGNHCWVAHGR